MKKAKRELRKYHVRIPLGDPDLGYTLWETVNAAYSPQEALKITEAQLKIYTEALQRALGDVKSWKIVETDLLTTGGTWQSITKANQQPMLPNESRITEDGVEERDNWKQRCCGECKFWGYSSCFLDNDNKYPRWWNARACRDFVDANRSPQAQIRDRSLEDKHCARR